MNQHSFPPVSAMEKSLEEVRKLVSRSQDSDWTPFTPDEIQTMLKAEINGFKKNGQRHGRLDIEGLFSAAGPVQEIAMANGWEREFSILAARIDLLSRQIPFALTFRNWAVNLVLPVLTYLVILLLLLIDDSVRADILSLNGGIALLVVTIAGYGGTWLVLGRQTIAVSSGGIRLNSRTVDWNSVKAVKLTSIKIPTVTIQMKTQWMPVIGVLRIAPSVAAMHIDLASNFRLDPEVRDAADKLADYMSWREANLANSLKPEDLSGGSG